MACFVLRTCLKVWPWAFPPQLEPDGTTNWNRELVVPELAMAREDSAQAL
ncbi:conserved hypothetical protein [Ricinus communis]|uniref:Uncharacterized protein n=1 Tax=Ricinus communis TaxID=3988 RepID=B9SHJ9_RICCO|nr:conserved hypothetical protein [Ricinus communis]